MNEIKQITFQSVTGTGQGIGCWVALDRIVKAPLMSLLWTENWMMVDDKKESEKGKLSAKTICDTTEFACYDGRKAILEMCMRSDSIY